MTLLATVGFNNRKVINIASDGTCGKKLVERFPLKGFEDCIKDAPKWVKMSLWTLCAFKGSIFFLSPFKHLIKNFFTCQEKKRYNNKIIEMLF